MQSSSWLTMQQQLMQAYQGVLKAYSLKLTKYPAVVSDDHHVVYGTADVAVAEQLLAEFRRRGDAPVFLLECAGTDMHRAAGDGGITEFVTDSAECAVAVVYGVQNHRYVLLAVLHPVRLHGENRCQSAALHSRCGGLGL